MLLKPIVYPRWVILLFVWGICLALLFLTARRERFSPAANYTRQRADFESSNTNFGGFGYARREPKCDGRLLHFISFNNLRVENSDVGIFKTAMSREIVLEKLKLRLYDYEQSNSAEIFDSVIIKLTGVGKSSPEKITERIENYLRRCTQVLPAARNVTGLRIKGFDCDLFRGAEPWLCITSAKAEFSGRDNELVLRGRVVVESGSGRTLRANHIRWNIIEDKFRVKGVYALDCEQGVICGKDAFFDGELFTSETEKKLFVKE